ncbi:MAG: glycoside hydrolase family 43 protein [Bacteroides sp.]|nr:glycoside hydrolase family 43 protein [Bacteroides sp.]MCM1456544.1 glycoside hydrolase family 43 protein [Lachnoclostridium sp.]
MRKTIIFTLLSSALISMCGCRQKTAENTAEYVMLSNPLPVKFGDPFILPASDGKFYLYGTSLSDGFEAYVSDNLVEWKKCGQVYKGGADGQWNKDCFWAPEVYERDGKYYMFYSANSRNNPNREDENFMIGVAVADKPDGPFTDLFNRPLFEAPYPVIDANVLFDDSGKKYIYFSRCCYKHPVESEIADKARAEGFCNEVEESWVYGAELKDDFSGLASEPILLLSPPAKLDDRQAEWESRSVTSREINRRWTEGSYIFKSGATYYIMYSGNYYGGGNYAVGYATAKSPLGPFTKADNNPILQENVSTGGPVLGTGHNMVFTNPADSQLYTVYHGRMSDNPDERVVFIDKVNVDTIAQRLSISGPTTAPQAIAVK